MEEDASGAASFIRSVWVGPWLGFLPKIQSHLLVIREWFILHVLVDRSVYSYAMVCIPTTYEAYEKSTPLRYPVADIDSPIARFFLCPSWRFNVGVWHVLSFNRWKFGGIHAALEGQWRLKRCRLDENIYRFGEIMWHELNLDWALSAKLWTSLFKGGLVVELFLVWPKFIFFEMMDLSKSMVILEWNDVKWCRKKVEF